MASMIDFDPYPASRGRKLASPWSKEIISNYLLFFRVLSRASISYRVGYGHFTRILPSLNPENRYNSNVCFLKFD